jgi:hypothetical protein
MPRRRWPHCHPKRCLRGSLCRPQLQLRAHIFLRRSRCKRWLSTANISLRNIAPRNSMPPWRRSTAQQCNPCIQMPQLQSRSPLGTRSGRRKPQPPKASLRRTRCSSSLPLRKNICLRGIGGTLRQLCSFPQGSIQGTCCCSQMTPCQPRRRCTLMRRWRAGTGPRRKRTPAGDARGERGGQGRGR